MERGKVNSYCRKAFTLVELLIVVVILGILAAVVFPQFSDASEEARFARLTTDLKNVRMAIAVYTMEHGGRAPSIKANGSKDNNADNLIERLTGRTDPSGGINATGAHGPAVRRDAEAAWADADAWLAGLRAQIQS